MGVSDPRGGDGGGGGGGGEGGGGARPVQGEREVRDQEPTGGACEAGFGLFPGPRGSRGRGACARAGGAAEARRAAKAGRAACDRMCRWRAASKSHLGRLLSLDLRRGASMASDGRRSPTLTDARTRGADRGSPTREPAPDAVDATPATQAATAAGWPSRTRSRPASSSRRPRDLFDAPLSSEAVPQKCEGAS